jgi:hypothetical protein
MLKKQKKLIHDVILKNRGAIFTLLFLAQTARDYSASEIFKL